jgi:hypothetical protein
MDRGEMIKWLAALLQVAIAICFGVAAYRYYPYSIEACVIFTQISFFIFLFAFSIIKFY